MHDGEPPIRRRAPATLSENLMVMEPVVHLLSDLVAIPSMNPMGRSRSGKEYSEQTIAEYVQHYLKKNSIDVQLQDIEPGRPNVVGVLDVGASKTILLEAHLDTVHADNMVVEPFTPTIRDGMLYGRGACDTKSSVASIIQATINTLGRGRLGANLILLFPADEEYRFGGAQYAARQGLKADFGIIGEPTSLSIIRAHKGVTRWRIYTKGELAHSAYPERGKNAIYLMAEVIQKLEQFARELAERSPHPLLGSPRMSVGVIEGGQAVNIVPDRCWIEIDRRTLPGESENAILQETKTILRNCSDWEFEPPYLSVGGMELSEEEPAVQKLSQCVRECVGASSIEVAPYGTDAGVYAAIGIPCVVFGPGNIAQAHTDSEYVELSQIEQAVQIIERFISS
ncbi:MAG TPA: acetylornithine deacetylase [Bacteroidetes bacterium]|nr:acetylornithine deacetylase [Bacteroidota bacterium]